MNDNENTQQALAASQAPTEQSGVPDSDLWLRFKALDYALAGLPRGAMDGAEYLPDLAFDVLAFLQGTYDPDKFDKPVDDKGGTADVIDFAKFREYQHHDEDDDEPELPF